VAFTDKLQITLLKHKIHF